MTARTSLLLAWNACSACLPKASSKITRSIRAHANNYWKGYWIKHPAQCNLYGLPTDLVVAILRDLIALQNNGQAEVRNYADWLVATYGRTFAETFPMQYGRKFHTTVAENMTTDWLGPRLYRPSLEEVLQRGAVAGDGRCPLHRSLPLSKPWRFCLLSQDVPSAG